MLNIKTSFNNDKVYDIISSPENLTIAKQSAYSVIYEKNFVQPNPNLKITGPYKKAEFLAMSTNSYRMMKMTLLLDTFLAFEEILPLSFNDFRLKPAFLHFQILS